MVFWMCTVDSGHTTCSRGGMFSVKLSETGQENPSLKN